MKLTAILLFVGIIQVSAKSYAQRVTLDVTAMPLIKVFALMEQQTGYSFIYLKEQLKQSRPITLTVKNEKFEDILDLIFKDQPLTYSISGKHIAVKLKEADSPNAVSHAASNPPINITGRILNESGEAIVGASVTLKSGNGTVSNGDGRFSMNVNPGDVITVSYVGYLGISVKIVQVDGKALNAVVLHVDRQYNDGVEDARNKSNQTSSSVVISSDEIIFSLIKRNQSLEEVTVKTNYWETTKRLSVGNISKVTAKEIGFQPVTSPLLALQGRVAGLEITMSSNATPGVAPIIRIRGNNSLRMYGKNNNGVRSQEDDGNYPLYVIDGVPVISSPLLSQGGDLTTGGYDPISTINPGNIESIEILKDADATAIYGSRGANGVILITTKQNKGGEHTNLDISVYRGAGQVSRKLNLLNTEQYLAMRQEALANYGISAIDKYDIDLKYWDPSRYTDWQKVLLGGTANITDIQGNITGSTRNTSFLIGGGFHKETLIFSSDFGYQRASGNASIKHTSTNQRFRASINLNYGTDKNNLFADNDGIMSRALTLPPNAPKLYNDDGSLNWEIHTIQGRQYSTWINPLAARKNKQNVLSRNLISNVNISYKVVTGLSLLVSAGYTDLSNNEKSILPIAAYSPIEKNTIGIARFNDIHRNSWIIEPKISYSQKIKMHTLDFLLGTSWQEANSSNLNINASQYTSDALLGSLVGAGRIIIFRDDYAEYKYRSLYGRIGYNWKQKYLVNFTGRRDASSRFSPNKRVGNFGSIGLGWIFSEEPFIQKSIPFLSFGKFRGSYGINGSDAVADYQFYNLYEQIPGGSYNGVRGIVPSALYNPDFVWEATKKLELGLEMAFLDNRLGIDVSWYLNRSSNQLINYTMPYITGFPSIISNFNATVQNTGLEAVFRAEPVADKNWRWNISFNLSIPRNKLLKFDGIENSPYVNEYKVGAPLSIQWLYNWTGVDPQTGLHTFEDRNKDGIISNLDKTLMNPMDSKYYGGMNNTVQYKAFELSVQFQYSNKPGFRYLPGTPGSIFNNQSIEVLNRWFVPGDQADVQKFAPSSIISASGFSNSSEGHNTYEKALQSNYKIQDASFIRLKSLLLSYAFPPNVLKKIKFQQIKFFIQGQNLLTITSYKGLDPETGSGLPPLRMVSGGIQLQL